MAGLGMVLLLLIFCVLLTTDVAAIPLRDFYPYGSEAGDTLLPRIDDVSSHPIAIPSGFTFFGKSFSTIYVNSNGNLSPGQPHNTFVPHEMFHIPILAVFWSDVDTSLLDGGSVWYRSTETSVFLSEILGEIKSAYRSVSTIDHLVIATWYRVRYFNSNDDNRTNTFQCVFAVSGDETYTIYRYADEHIQWSRGGRALVGYNTGDGINGYAVPGSQTEDIVRIASSSNVGVGGIWVFRLDEEELVLPKCFDNTLSTISLSPQFGVELGGTFITVTVSSPCINKTDSVSCFFGGIFSSGHYIDKDKVACVSPAMDATGRIDMKLEVKSSKGVLTFNKSASFHSIPILNAHGVDVQLPNNTIVVNSRTNLNFTWVPATVLPSEDNPDSFTVDVTVYSYDYDGKEWVIRSRRKNLPNNGSTEFGMSQFSDRVQATCIHITVGQFIQPSMDNSVQQVIKALSSLKKKPFPSRVGIWSSLLFSVVIDRDLNESEAIGQQNMQFRRKCSEWCDMVGPMPLKNVVDKLPPCPPTQDRAQLPNSELEEVNYESKLYSTNNNYNKQWLETFNSKASTCFQQRNVASGSPGQECCYDDTGNLIVGSPSGGSANRYAPVDFVSFREHIQHDVLPKIYCCSQSCEDYYQRRPSDDGQRYRPPIPAGAYGDPHIVTLDGLKYTFNGKGEFILIETTNNIITLQGRMVEVPSNLGQAAPATVFSAIACKQNDSDTVQFTVTADNVINTTVNGELVAFSMLAEQSYMNVVVMDKGNTSYAATFSSGAYIEVQSANGFMSLLLVSLPNNYINTTKGLMGSFNGDTVDDLAPKVGNGTGDPIPSDSSLEEIHDQFGITWIIHRPENSIFLYRESLGESWAHFYDPDYTPAFSPTFDDPDLEEMAIELCGDNQFCLFDIAATKRPEIGMTTTTSSEEIDMIINMSKPVVCNPLCENGACVATNTCMCAQGYNGDTCSVPVMTECEENVCENGGTCQILAESIICTCPPHLTGVVCELLLPPDVVNDTITDAPLMTVPLIITPNELGFVGYRHLISLCYEVRGTPGDIINLVSTKCTSINARYERLSGNSEKTIFGVLGIRTVDYAEECSNIQVNRGCSVLFNQKTLSSDFTINNISVNVRSNSISISLPNCGREIAITVRCLLLPADNIPVMNITITRNYVEQDTTHGIIGQFWSATVSSKPYIGDPTGLIPGYDPYTLTVEQSRIPRVSRIRDFVGVLIPRLWNHDSGQCIYAGNSVGGSTGTGPSAPRDSVIEGDYHYYLTRGLFRERFLYSKFQSRICS